MGKNKKIWRGFAGILILAALTGSFICQMIATKIPTPFGRVIGYFSYFTEYSNILVMLWFINKSFLNGKIKFLNKKSVRGALTLYICIAGLVYFFVLESAWNQQGIEMIQSYILHGFAPIAFVLDWIVFGEKGNYTYKDIRYWVIFPIVYLFIALFFGKVINVYPYPFLDLNVITLNKFLMNVIQLVVEFLVMAFIIVSMDKLLNKVNSFRKKSVKFVNNN